jgi:hypothetical protein
VCCVPEPDALQLASTALLACLLLRRAIRPADAGTTAGQPRPAGMALVADWLRARF